MAPQHPLSAQSSREPGEYYSPRTSQRPPSGAECTTDGTRADATHPDFSGKATVYMCSSPAQQH
eukprot:8658618-Pyramimonas_sp.AAC.1